jgi:hypothetical protein
MTFLVGFSYTPSLVGHAHEYISYASVPLTIAPNMYHVTLPSPSYHALAASQLIIPVTIVAMRTTLYLVCALGASPLVNAGISLTQTQ